MKSDALLTAAMKRLREHIRDARQRGMSDAHSASLATATPDGKPSVRTVFLMDVDDQGFHVATRTDSGKAAQMRDNPAVSLCMVWQCLQRQLTIEGIAEACDDATADRLWGQRMRDEQLAAWASENVPGDDRVGFRAAVNAARKQFSGLAVPRPENWGGFRIYPTRVIEWPTGWHRSRQRIRIERDAEGHWHEQSLRA